MGRISSVINSDDKATITFLGSSITGRIPGTESGINRYGNLGIDASSAREGMDYILSGNVPHAENIVIELNTLYVDLPLVNQDAHKFKNDRMLYRLLPICDPVNRISALLYTELRDERSNPANNDIWPLNDTVEDQRQAASYQPDEMDAIIVQSLKEFRGKISSNLFLVNYPTPGNRKTPDSRLLERGRWLSRQLGIPLIDLPAMLPASVEISFSDHVHMKSNDALTAANTIRAIIAQPSDFDRQKQDAQ